MGTCQYGELPGTWDMPPSTSLAYGWEDRPFNHPMLPFLANNASDHYGSRWQTLDEECQLRNLIAPYLHGNKPASSKPVRILVFGDSTGRNPHACRFNIMFLHPIHPACSNNLFMHCCSDTHVLNFFIEHLYRSLGNTSEEYKHIFNNSRIWLHDRGPNLNHVITNVGLELYQMFILGIDPRQPDSSRVEVRVTAARRQFSELMGNSSFQPDIIVLHNAHWTLLNMASENNPTTDMDMASASSLPASYIASYMEQFAHLAHLVRIDFPDTPITLHTAAMVRHDVSTGHTEGKRAWVNRLFIEQLNEAGREVARKLHMPIVDWDHITRGLVPGAYRFDDIHPTGRIICAAK